LSNYELSVDHRVYKEQKLCVGDGRSQSGQCAGCGRPTASLQCFSVTVWEKWTCRHSVCCDAVQRLSRTRCGAEILKQL